MIDARHISSPARGARSSCHFERYNTNVQQKAGRKIKNPGKYGISIGSAFDLSDVR
jgi:hypothetical protein